MGVGYIPADHHVTEALRRDVKLGCFVRHRESSVSRVQATTKYSVQVRTQLKSTKGVEEARRVTSDAFVKHLKRMIRVAD